MTRFTLAILIPFAAMSFSAAQEKGDQKEGAKVHSMTGYLVDQMCARRITKNDAETATKKAIKHSKECALEDACKETGYGLISNGKWYKFDDAGDKQASEYLDKTSRKDNIFVEVTGTMEGDKMSVTAIKDAKSEKNEKKGTKESSTSKDKS